MVSSLLQPYGVRVGRYLMGCVRGRCYHCRLAVKQVRAPGLSSVIQEIGLGVNTEKIEMCSTE